MKSASAAKTDETARIVQLRGRRIDVVKGHSPGLSKNLKEKKGRSPEESKEAVEEEDRGGLRGTSGGRSSLVFIQGGASDYCMHW